MTILKYILLSGCYKPITYQGYCSVSVVELVAGQPVAVSLDSTPQLGTVNSGGGLTGWTMAEFVMTQLCG